MVAVPACDQHDIGALDEVAGDAAPDMHGEIVIDQGAAIAGLAGDQALIVNPAPRASAS